LRLPEAQRLALQARRAEDPARLFHHEGKHRHRGLVSDRPDRQHDPAVALETGISASEYANQFIDTATKEREPLKRWTSTQGPFNAHACIIRDDSGGPPVFVYNLIIANDRTGTIYVVLYEAPEEDWEKAWRIGAPILKLLIILDDSEWLQPIRDEPSPVV
jgi:hypothetical protein